MYKKYLLFILIVVFCIAWSNDPAKNTPVCTAKGSQAAAGIVTDGSGGAIIVWNDSRNGIYDHDVYVQRLNASGKTLWGQNGRVVASGSGNQVASQIVPDGQGGTIFAYTEENGRYNNNFTAYMMRIDSQGKIRWISEQIDDTMPDSSLYSVAADGSGGALIFWPEERNGDNRIYGQHIGSNGDTLWSSGGIPISTAEGEQHTAFAVTDGKGGAVIMWINWSPAPLYKDLYAQRIDSNGNKPWGQQGVLIDETPISYEGLKLYPDRKGGAFFGWFGDCYSTSDTYMQHLNSQGQKLWGPDGVVVHRCPYGDAECEVNKILLDKKGGVFVLVENNFIDYLWGRYSYHYVDIQHVNASGEMLWGERGLSISSDSSYRYVNMVSDCTGGVIVAKQSYENNNYRLRAQRFDAAGESQWTEEWNLAATVNFGDRSRIRMISDRAGGAIMTWPAKKHDEWDIYAQNICGSGNIGDCTQAAAVIDADRFGGITPVTIQFDGSGSLYPNGTIIQWEWDFGDGSSGSGEKINHTYNKPGTYWVSLRVKDNHGRWSDPVEEKVRAFSPGSIDAKIEFGSDMIKAKEKDLTLVNAACYETPGISPKRHVSLFDKPKNPAANPANLPGNTVKTDIGLTLTVTSGTLLDELNFDSSTGYYSRYLLSGTPGEARVSAVVDDYVLAVETIEFAWPLPPANVRVEFKENRSLLRGEYYAYLSWSENPQEVFTPAKYRIYRSSDGGPFELVGEVDAAVFSYEEAPLPAGHQYSYAVSMVDSEGDESSFSAPLSPNR